MAPARFGVLVAELAVTAGYDLTPGGTGRAALARDTGMSLSAVGRMLTGKTLPLPSQYESIASAVRTDVRRLLVEGNVISPDCWPEHDNGALPSQPHPLTPESAVESWGIKEPLIRSMLLSQIETAIRLQQHQDGLASAGGATVKG